jgi:hypothetical protein
VPRRKRPARAQSHSFRAAEAGGVYGPKTCKIFVEAIRTVLKPRDRKPVWQWYDENIEIPLLVGSTRPGPLNTGIMPQWRSLLEIVYRPRIRSFDLCKSARIGGTLMFGIGPILYNLAEECLPALWIDPTRKTAIRLSRQELQPHIRECRATNRLRIPSKTHWTALEMIFKTGTLGIVGAGSIADLGGRQAGVIVVNEQDKIPNKHRAEATPKLLAKIRAKQFIKDGTAKIFGNSTPTLESGLTWGDFLAGSQRWCYVRCPECERRQRLTFFSEPAEPDRWMRLDEYPDPKDLTLFSGCKPAEDGRGWLVRGIPATGKFTWPKRCKDNRDKSWDVDAVGRETSYECAHCHAHLSQKKLPAMLRTAQWWAHNPTAPEDHESAQHWGAYSPFEDWGYFSKKWLLAQGSAARIHDFFNSDLGLPYVATPTRITKKSLELLQQAARATSDRIPTTPTPSSACPRCRPASPCTSTFSRPSSGGPSAPGCPTARCTSWLGGIAAASPRSRSSRTASGSSTTARPSCARMATRRRCRRSCASRSSPSSPGSSTPATRPSARAAFTNFSTIRAAAGMVGRAAPSACSLERSRSPRKPSRSITRARASATCPSSKGTTSS